MIPPLTLTAQLLADGRPEELNEVTVSPGVPGFLAIFVIAVATVFLARAMMRRVRRVSLTERDREAAAERQQAAESTEGTAGPAGDDPARAAAADPAAETTDDEQGPRY